MKYHVPIPGFYVGLTEGCEDRGRIFKQYVQGYLKKNHSELNLIKIEGMTAICERRESHATR